MEQTKKCTTCQLELPLSSFSKNRTQKDGHHRECKADVKAYQLTIKDKLKAYQHDYQKVYRAENKEQVTAYAKKWMANNRDKCNSYAKKSNEKNPQRMKDYMKVWNAKKKAEKLAQQNGQQ
jgi:hypothetical protein